MQDRQMGEIEAGHFVGEIRFMKDDVALDTVVAMVPDRHVSWLAHWLILDSTTLLFCVDE